MLAASLGVRTGPILPVSPSSAKPEAVFSRVWFGSCI